MREFIGSGKLQGQILTISHYLYSETVTRHVEYPNGSGQLGQQRVTNCGSAGKPSRSHSDEHRWLTR